MNKNNDELGILTCGRLAELACESESGPGVTRIFASDEHKRAAAKIGSWMHDAGMDWHIDAIGNVVGRYQATGQDAPSLILASHQDTVRQGGQYDGAMGVMLPITCVDHLHKNGIRLPFNIDVVAFSDEEGVRYSTTLLGSRALAGTFDMDVLNLQDRDGVSMRQALTDFGCDPEAIPSLARKPGSVLGYIEAHIEQGPVLERTNLPVGVVTGIVHGLRLRAVIEGEAGHAGTVPMGQRSDALCAASECVLSIENLAGSAGLGCVGTVGMLETRPGAINVIPGAVEFTIDLRAPEREHMQDVRRQISAEMEQICHRRQVSLTLDEIYDSHGCDMSPELMDVLQKAIEKQGFDALRLPSGAGHDAMAMTPLCDIAMLFVRCAGGVSHNPAEFAEQSDIGVAAGVLLDAIEILAAKHGPAG